MITYEDEPVGVREMISNTDRCQEINKIYDFLKKADEEVEVSPNEDIVLLLGNTGAGKSSLVQFIAGYEEELISVKVGGGGYIIRDKKNLISNDSTILSQTIFPNLIINERTNNAYYDCPGFSDTRGPHHEIAATYTIKKILDSAKSDEGNEPDEGSETDEGSEPDEGSETDEGCETDEGSEPDEGSETDEGSEPDEGNEPDDHSL